MGVRSIGIWDLSKGSRDGRGGVCVRVDAAGVPVERRGAEGMLGSWSAVEVAAAAAAAAAGRARRVAGFSE